jgi:outer membrane protein OmpA-like peptidoglycan-associated protein
LRRENEAQRTAALTEADRLKQENDARMRAAQNELDRAAREKAELRARLLQQFNAILQTRDTARGLIVNLSDVLFDTGKFTLRPEAREKLARVAGITAGHPGLKVDVEGRTDSIGTDGYSAHRNKRHRRGPSTESARRTRDLGRNHWRGNRNADRDEVISSSFQSPLASPGEMPRPASFLSGCLR